VIFKVQPVERVRVKKDGSRAGVSPKEYKEAVVQRFLYDSRASWKGRVLRGCTVAPKVYFSGYVGDGGGGSALHIICMELVVGTPSYKVRTTSALRDALSKAILTMWLCGVAHTDLHGSNIMVSKKSGKYSVRIIDYGLASRLPKHVVDKVARRMALGTAPSDFKDAYRDIIKPYLTRRPRFAGIGRYDNGNILEKMFG
jgi:tRNA A-37 threonylcarbamoyl transferase component Bud32